MALLRELFNRRGGISGRAYWIQCAVLLCAGIVLHLLAFGFIYAVNLNMFTALSGVEMVVITFGLIALLFYPYLCLYTKRLRDIGVSAYWYIAVFVVYCVLFIALPNAITALSQTAPAELFVPSLTIAPSLSDGEQVAAINQHSRSILMTTAILTAMTHAIITISIDVVLGKMKPRNGQEVVVPNGAAFA